MGILKTIKYSEFDPELNCYLKEVEMDISFMRIAVKKIRVIKEQNLVYISSPNYSEGHLFNFDMINSGWAFTIRRLEGVDNDHILSPNGVFTRRGYTKVHFHYFTLQLLKQPVLSYSLDIDFQKAYLSLKSKTNQKEISSIFITASDGSNMGRGDIPEPVEIKVQNEPYQIGVEIKVKKKYKVKKLSMLHDFEILLKDYFDIQGQGIDINYSVSVDQDFVPNYFLSADEQIDGYDLSSTVGSIDYFEPINSKKNLVMIKSSNPSNKNTEIIYVFETFQMKEVLLETSQHVQDIRIAEYDIEGKSKYCLLYQTSAQSNDAFSILQIWWNGMMIQKFQIDTKNIKLVSSKVQQEYLTMAHIARSGNERGLWMTRFKCTEVFQMNENTVVVEPYIEHYDFINMGLLEDNSEVIVIFMVDSDRMFSVKAYKLSTNSKGIESYEVDTGNLNSFMSVVQAPLKVKSHMVSGSGKVDIIVDGSDFQFFLITTNIEIDKIHNVVKLSNIQREEYSKSNILFRVKYRVTQDFIVCTSYSSPLRRYLPSGNKRVASLMVWAKRNGQYKGNGYSYRLQDLGNADTQHSIVVNDHANNIISVVVNMLYISTIKLKNEIKLIRKGMPVKHSQTEQQGLQSWDIRLRGNFWSLSDKYISAEDFIIVEEMKKKEENNATEDTALLTFWLGLSFLAFVIVIFGLIFWCMYRLGQKKDLEGFEYESALQQSLLTDSNSSVYSGAYKGNMLDGIDE